jgi:hypothetical protein
MNPENVVSLPPLPPLPPPRPRVTLTVPDWVFKLPTYLPPEERLLEAARQRLQATAPPAASGAGTATPTGSPFLRLNEAAAYCRLKPQTLLNHRREIKVVRSRPLLFRREDLDQWLSDRKRKRRK